MTDTENLYLLVNKDHPMDFSRLLSVWNHMREPGAVCESAHYTALTRRFSRMGEYILAFDVVNDGRKRFPDNTALIQLKAHILTRMGIYDKAETLLLRLSDSEKNMDAETLGLLGSIYKHCWEYEKDPDKKAAYARQSFDSYNRGYETNSDNYWTGINAATMALVIRDSDKAFRLAEQVKKTCIDIINREKNYWALNTLASAYLIPGEYETAETYYRSAADTANRDWGELHTSRHHAILIMENLNTPEPARKRIEKTFRLPVIVVFAGHMTDREGRTPERLPGRITEQVREQIASEIQKIGPCIGYASAACGADILFHEVLAGLGYESHVVLPYNKDCFRKDSVEIVEPDHWRERFFSVIRQAKEVTEVSLQKLELGTIAYEYANFVLYGRAISKAKEFETGIFPVFVWDEKEGDGPAGTASMVNDWIKLGYQPGKNMTIINPDKFLSGADTDSPSASTETKIQPAAPYIKKQTDTENPAGKKDYLGKPKIRAILFADVTRFSMLNELQIPHFVNHFMTAIARLIEESPYKPIVKNTWGDGLYLVFKKVEAAGLFALDLSDLIESTDWEKKGLNRETNIRIALHAGPVYSCIDPIIKQHTYTGHHVSLTARLEPITPPGKVYSSHQFAALAAYYNIAGFRCEYVGKVPFAKSFGTYPTYCVRRGNIY